ncbi:M12 family metallo-peptidase [Imbroritus primus]|uniref:M12 family metallo-peptidase n=1 Tax=Imbroritus primus TaxID=3058603 RepID=UPI003D162019
MAAAAAVMACGGGGGGGSGGSGSGSSASLSGEAGNLHDLSGQVRFSTTAPQAGEMLEIRGAGLEPIALLDIAGIRLSPEKRRDANGETVLRVTMPRLTLAENQPVNVVGYGGDGQAMKLSNSTFAWCPIGIDRLSSATASPGMAVELSGACLDRATQVRWGGMDIPILRRSARGVVIAINATQSASYRVELRTASGFALNGPTLDFNAGLAPGLRIDPMIGQVNLLPAASPMLRLIPGKTAMVMARISRPYGVSVSRASARVELLDTLGTRFATYPLQGDDAFPDVPGADNAMENNYFAVIPPDQVANIRTVRIVAEDSASNLTQSVSFQPPVAPGTSFRLHLVPIARPGGAPAPLPNPNRVQAVLSAMFPVSRIEVVAHAPVTFSGSSDAFSQKDLFDLTALRAQEGAQSYEFYFGVQPEPRNAGLAYVGGTTATGFHTWPTNTSTAGLFGGADAALITELIAHEVAHNFGRTHTFEDSSYPYANGRLGTYAGLSLFQNSPAALPGSQWYDVMSYSAPKWFSDYSAYGVQRDAELRAIRLPTAGALAGLRSDSTLQAVVAPLRLLEISGDPASGNVSLHSTLDHTVDTLAAQPVADALRSGVSQSLWIRIGLADGSTQWFVPTLRSVSDGDAQALTASVHLPAAMQIASVALVRDGSVVRSWPQTGDTASTAPTAMLQESAGRITVRWDPQYRLSLVHLSARGVRTAVAVNLTGVQVTLNAPQEAGGSWMWSLTDGLALHQGSQSRTAGI